MATCAHCGAVGDHAKKYCPNCRDTSTPWRPDKAAIDRARKILGVTLEVRVITTDRDDPIGRYYEPVVAKGNPYHPIDIARRLSVESASRCLWHELTHAAQWEANPDFVEDYGILEQEAIKLAEKMNIPYAQAYRMIPFELEAKANEEYHYTKFPLMLPNLRASLPNIPDHHRIAQVINGHIVKGHAYDEIERNVRANINKAKEILNR